MNTKVLALLLLLASSFFLATSEAHQDKKKNKKQKGALPVVINTWAFVNATAKAWETIFDLDLSAIDAVERGCSVCEEERCDGTVGYGGSPDENGETTLDAMVMDGTSMDVGAVGALRRVKSAISVARHVLERTRHTLLVGDQATEFAKAMGFPEETLQTEESRNIWADWKARSCQPNYWTNVLPDPGSSCGPYRPGEWQRGDDESLNSVRFSRYNHDTIGMVVVDAAGNVVAGTSTNGARHKIPGRVGDSPIPGAGAYADSQVGGAAATGDGDVMMRFLPSFHAVEELRRGATPAAAAEAAVGRITSRHPDFMGGVVVVSKSGDYGAACHGMDTFPFSVRNVALGRVVVEEVPCGPSGATVITL